MAMTQDELLRQLTRKRAGALRGVLQTCGWDISDLAELLRARRKELHIDHTDPTSAFQEALAERQMLSIGLCTEIAVYLDMKPVEMYFEPLHQREQQTLDAMLITLLPLINTKPPAGGDQSAEAHAASHAANDGSSSAPTSGNAGEKANAGEMKSSDDPKGATGSQEEEQASGKTLQELRRQALEDALDAADITVNELARRIFIDGEKMGTLIATIGACKRGNRFFDDDLIARIAPALNVKPMQLKVRERTDADYKPRAKRASGNGQAAAPHTRTVRAESTAQPTRLNGSIALDLKLDIPRATLLRILESQETPAEVNLEEKEFVITFRCPAKEVLLGALND